MRLHTLPGQYVSSSVVFMSTKKLYYFEMLTGKTLIDCEEPAVTSETGRVSPAVLVLATSEPSEL